MLLDAEKYQGWDSPWGPVFTPDVANEWTVLVPFFNERDFLGGTLASLAAQDVPFDLILIDNGSTDGSADVVEAVCRRLGLAFTLLVERRPGKVNALRAGVERTRTRYVATCDADTLYPPHYLRQAARLLDRSGAAAGGAYFVAPDAAPEDHVAAARRMARAATLLPGQCHTGGAGQVFRTAALRDAGQFDAGVWRYVLEDHEIMHRVGKLGPIAYGGDFWCAPSPRDRDRESIRWTLIERILYHVTPGPARDWFFYDFLGRRLAARRLTSDRIRERPFQAPALAWKTPTRHDVRGKKLGALRFAAQGLCRDNHGLAGTRVRRFTRASASAPFSFVSDAGLRAFFLSEQPMLLRLLTARLGNRADAEDALQDMWLKLDQLPGTEPVAQPSAYLYRMASNLASDKRISATRGGARDTAWLDVQPSAEEQPTIERTLLGRERLARVEAALAAMPERMSAALRLYRVEQLPQKQIAERLGMTVSGVEKLLRRAVKEISAYNDAAEADLAEPHRLSVEGKSLRGL